VTRELRTVTGQTDEQTKIMETNQSLMTLPFVLIFRYISFLGCLWRTTTS